MVRRMLNRDGSSSGRPCVTLTYSLILQLQSSYCLLPQPQHHCYSLSFPTSRMSAYPSSPYSSRYLSAIVCKCWLLRQLSLLCGGDALKYSCGELRWKHPLSCVVRQFRTRGRDGDCMFRCHAGAVIAHSSVYTASSCLNYYRHPHPRVPLGKGGWKCLTLACNIAGQTLARRLRCALEANHTCTSGVHVMRMAGCV
jgi:hypothetical protein